MNDSNFGDSVSRTDSDKKLFKGLMKEVVHDVYDLKAEYWHLDVDARRNEDGIWEFESFKASDTES